MITGIRPYTAPIGFGSTQAKKAQKPSEEELKAAGYPMTYEKDGEIWHRNIAKEYGMSDDFDCDREDDPDYMIYPGQYYLSHDVWESLQKSIKH